MYWFPDAAGSKAVARHLAKPGGPAIEYLLLPKGKHDMIKFRRVASGMRPGQPAPFRHHIPEESSHGSPISGGEITSP
jgi:hypothetical protein